MTAGLLIQKAWEELGEPSDLNPGTIGVPKFIDALNDAQDVTAQWIDNRGRKVFFREAEVQIPFTTIVVSGTVDLSSTTNIIELPVSVAASATRYFGWVLQIGSESRLVTNAYISGGRNVVTVSSPFSSDVLGQDFVLAKLSYSLTGEDAIDTGGVRVAEILRVFDMADGSQLEEAPSNTHISTGVTGVPGQWKHKGTGIMFGSAPITERKYMLHCVKLPAKINIQTDEIELPDAFCQAVQLRMVWWGYRRMQDFQAAYASKKEFEELMTRLATASWLNNELDYFTVRSR